jgi:hypothetical protein
VINRVRLNNYKSLCKGMQEHHSFPRPIYMEIKGKENYVYYTQTIAKEA